MRGLLINLYRLMQQRLCNHVFNRRVRTFGIGKFTHVGCVKCEWLGYYEVL